jgi:L-lactate dehydrogenase complex protein LldE
MQVGLMVPCYIDMFYPHVGVATLELLEKSGVDVVYPKEQTCCGQPMANSGCYEEARATWYRHHRPQAEQKDERAS